MSLNWGRKKDHSRKGEVGEYACQVQEYEPGGGWVQDFVEEVLIVVRKSEPHVMVNFEQLHLDQPW